jgi:uncharacterized protein (DUF2252 family)
MRKSSNSKPVAGTTAKRISPSPAPAPADQGTASPAEGDDKSLESWQEPGPYDPAGGVGPWKERRATGKAVRGRVPREAHAEWQPPADRPDPVSTLLASNEGRQSELLPMRMGRMAASPFGFLRGAAVVMAWDLAHTPTTGLPVVLAGDAHLSNFGLYGTPQQEVVFDLNDFDETTVGPWEWDLKRLVVSVNVVARENQYTARGRRRAVMDCVHAYRENATRLQSMGVMDIWYQHAFPGAKHSLVRWELKSHDVFKQAVLHAQQNTSKRLLPRVAQQEADGHWRFIADPPTLTRVDSATVAAVAASLTEYVETLTPERRLMMKCYRVADIAHRVVGVGSVGTRAYLVLLFGAGSKDPLFLQIKEALRPALAGLVPALPSHLTHEGRRVVFGQRFLQASSDVLLGWTSIAGRPFYVRQMRNMKGSLPLGSLNWGAFHSYSWACGALLARAHARTGDIAKIAGYCGNSRALDHALVDFAEAYGDQTERDHAALVTAIKQGRVEAVRNMEPGSAKK